MLFAGSVPDFGGIRRQRNRFTLISGDIGKLNNLTEAVCLPLLKSGSIFSVDIGTKAFVSDTKETYVYSLDDKWHNVREWKNPEKVRAGYVSFKIEKDNEPYVFHDEEYIEITVKVKEYDAENGFDGDELTTVIDGVRLTADDYTEDGYYVLYMNLDQASHFVFCGYYKTSYTLHIECENGETEEACMNRVTVHKPMVVEWCDQAIKS